MGPSGTGTDKLFMLNKAGGYGTTEFNQYYIGSGNFPYGTEIKVGVSTILNLEKDATGGATRAYFSSDRVGIGTATPSTIFETKQSVGTEVNNMGFVHDSGDSLNVSALWSNWTTGSARMDFRLGGSTNTYSKVSILNSGWVGIGTNSPQQMLHVSGLAENGYIAGRIENTATSGAADFDFKNSAQMWKIGVNTSNQFRIRDDDSAANVIIIASGAGANALNIISGGNIGIGVASPTAVLNIKAGTATAGTAPLKFTSGTNLTIPEAGAMEYDGTNLYFTPAAARKTVAFTDSNITGTASNVTGTVVVANGGTGATTLTGIIKGNGTSAMTALTGTTGYNAYWSDANTIGSEQYAAVSRGGTGAGTFTSGGVLYGNGTSALGVTAAGTNNQILTSNGTTPVWSSSLADSQISDTLTISSAGSVDAGAIKSGTLTVARGGTGATTLTGVLKGNGTSAITAMTGTANYAARWTDANTLGTGVLYDNGTSVGVGTTSPSTTLSVNGDTTVTGNLYLSGVVNGGADMAPNLLRNGYMNILSGGAPAGWSGTGVTIAAVSAFTKGFEGCYLPSNAAPCDAATPDDATATSQYWYSSYNKGPRIERGGLASGWHAITDGNILKVTGTGIAAGSHSYVSMPFERNVLGSKWHFKAWVKIVKGSQVCFGSDAGYNGYANGLCVTKAVADAADQGWYRFNGTTNTSQITSLDGLALSIGTIPDGAGDVEVYVALPYVANLNTYGTNKETWVPSISDSLSRDGLSINPANGNVGIGTSSPATKLEISESASTNAPTLRLSGWNSGAGIMGGQISFYENHYDNTEKAYINVLRSSDGTSPSLTFGVYGAERMRIDASGNVGIGTSAPTSKLEVNGAIRANSFGIGTNIPTSAIEIRRVDTTTEQGTRWTTTTGQDWKMYQAVGTSNFRFWTDGGGGDMMTLTTIGQVGIGTTSPTARLHIKAGTATAGTAPLKFTSGTNLTTAEAGAMEYDGTNLYFTPAAARKTVAFTDSNITGTAANVTGTVAVANGGTGATTLTGVLKGNGTSAVTAMTGTNGYNAYWSDANTLGSEQYVAASRGGLGFSASGIAKGGLISGIGAGTMGITALGTDGYCLVANSAAAGGVEWVTCGTAANAVSLQASTPGTQQTGNLNISGTGLFGGNIGIGTNTPGALLDIVGSSGNMASFRTSSGAFADSASINFQAARGQIGWDGSSGAFKLGTSDNSKSIIFANSLTNGSGEYARFSGIGNFGLGTRIPQQALTLGGGKNIAIELDTPDAPTLTPSTTGGTLAAATYFYKITALDGVGQTVGGTEASVTTTGATSSVAVSWTGVTGATTYRVYRGTSAGGENTYYASTNTSFTDTGTAGTAGTLPTATTAYSSKVTASGNSWFDGGNVGIGTSGPTNKLSVQQTAASGGETVAAINWRSTSFNLGYIGADSSNYNSGAIYIYKDGALNTRISANGSSYLMGGGVGIGTNSPDAYLHIKAGIANLAPLKLTSGTNLTTAEAGAMEYDGTNLYFTPASARKTVAFTDSNITGTASNVTGTVAVANGGTGATTLTGIIKGTGTSAMTALTGTTGYNAYWSDANTIAAEQYASVSRGGTGAGTFTSGGVLYGNGTSALGVTAAGTNNYLLYSNSGTPAWTNAPTISGANITGLDAGNISSGTLSVARGGTGVGTLTGVLKGNGTSAITAMTGTTDYIARWTDANTLGTGVLYDNGTNVGIGTASPSEKLDVSGTTRTSKLNVANYAKYVDGGNYPFNTALNGSTIETTPPLNDFIGNALMFADIKGFALTSSGSITGAANALRQGDTYASITNATLPIVIQVEGDISSDTSVSNIRAFFQAHGAITGHLVVEVKRDDDVWVTLADEDISLGGKEYWFSQSITNVASFSPTNYWPLHGVRYTITSLSQATTQIRKVGVYKLNGFTYPFLAEANPYFYGQMRSNSGGSITTPSYSWNGDLDTGFYHPAAGELGVVIDGAEKVRVDSSGNLGLGATAPSQKLDVQGNIAIAVNYLGGGQGYGHASANSYATLQMYNISTGYTTLNNQGYGIKLQTAGSDRLTILNGGNMGIGTASPTAALHLKAGTATAGTAPLKLTSGTNLTTAEAGAMEYDGTQLYFSPSTTRNILAQVSGGTALTAGSVPFATTSGYLTGDNANLFWNNTDKRLGIGTSSPTTIFETKQSVGTEYNNMGIVHDAGDNPNVSALWTNWSTGAARMDFRLGGSTSTYSKMSILNSGLVGIGTNSPQQLLHVSGLAENGYIAGRIENTATSGAADFDFKNSAQMWKIGVNTSNQFRVRDDTNTDNVIIIASGAGDNAFNIISGGNVGLGIASPTAHLHIKAGTATAGTAPLKFTSGTNLTTAEAGAMEYDGTNLYFTPASARKTIAFTDSNITGTAANVTGTVAVANGGTGLTTLTQNGILYGNGTGQVGVTAAGTNNYLLYSNGGTPAWTNTPTISGANITGLSAGNISSGILDIAYGGTGSSTGSITGTGALNFVAGGTDQNVALTPSGTGYTVLGGNVGIGTSSPSTVLHVVGNSTITGVANFTGSVAINTNPDNNASGFEYGNGYNPLMGNYANERFRVNSFLETPHMSLGAGTNYILRSEEFDNSSWVKTNIGTVSANGVNAPTGATSAENIPAGSAGTANLSQAVTNSTTGYWAAGVWARTQSGTATISLEIDSSAETGTPKTISLDTTWRFFGLSQNFTAANTTKTFKIITGTNAVSLWGARLNPGETVNAYRSTGSTAQTTAAVGAFFNNTTIYGTLSGNASSASYGTYASRGSYGGITISNTNNKSNLWEYLGYVTLTYNSTSTVGGQSWNYELDLKEHNDDNVERPQSEYEDVTLRFKGNLAAHADGNAFNALVPEFSLDLSGDTTLVSSDVAAYVSATSTSSKTLRIYIKLKDPNTHYEVNNINYAGLSYSASLGTTTSTSYISFTPTNATPVATLTAPTQGSLVYGTLRSSVYHSDLGAPAALTAGTPTSGGSCDAGTHRYKVTFVTVGGETAAGVPSSVVTCVAGTGQTVPLTNIPTGPTGTIARKVYRSKAGSALDYYLVTNIADNSTTTYTDTATDASLGAIAPTYDTAAGANIVAGGTVKMTVDSGGRVGIGTTAPSAFLQIKAGAAAEGMAPLKFTSGTNLTTAEAGAMEYDGTNLYFTPASSRKTVAFTDSNITGTASNITGILAVANGGTGTATGSITGTGALTFAAGGTDQNVTLTPSGTGYTVLGGTVGIGTSAPDKLLTVTQTNDTDGFRLHGYTVSDAYFDMFINSAGNPRFATGNSMVFEAGAGLYFRSAATTYFNDNTPRNTTFNGGQLYLTSTGKFGVGTAGPTATLHIKAGTAAAGTAPLKFTSGTNLTTAEAGAMEYDGTQLYFSPSTTRNVVAQVTGGVLTAGSIPFATTNGYLAGENANFFWDDTNNRLGIGTNAPSAQLTLKTIAANERASLGGELTDASNWTTTGWTGTYAGGFTHTVGNTSALSRTMANAVGDQYLTLFTISGLSAGGVTVGLGGDVTRTYYANGSYSYGMRAVSINGPLVITPTSDFNGTVSAISVKLISSYGSTQTIVDSADATVFEMRSSTDGLYNLFIGEYSGRYNYSGQYNTAVGASTLAYNTIGFFNSAFGYEALYDNTVGNYNTALGVEALYHNISGAYNTAVGYYSLGSNTIGEDNVSVGMNSLRVNTTGNLNTAVGVRAMDMSVDGEGNTAMGNRALSRNVSGDDNTAFGRQALYNATGSNNVGIGHYAGGDLTSGQYNTFLGLDTGIGITTGSYNTIIGSGVAGLAAGLSNTIILADGAGNQRLFIDANGNAGIGTTAPASRLEIAHNAATTALTVNQSGTGDIVSIQDSGVDIFKVGQATVEIARPLDLEAEGDVGIENNLQFLGNFTSFVNSAGPLTISAGDGSSYEHLTLTTGGTGDVIVDIAGSTLGFKVLGAASKVFSIDPNGNVAIGGLDSGTGSLTVKGNISTLGGNLDLNDVATPANVVVTPTGSTASTSYSYRVSATNGNGETLASTAGTTSSGYATLSASNYNHVTWSAVPGATGYKVYGRTSGGELLIASVAAPTLYYDDIGAVTPSGALPSLNTTGGSNITYSSTNGPKRSIILTATGAETPPTSGAAQTKVTGTNHTYYVLDYDAAADESAYWHWTMPDSYDGGKIEVTYYWEAAATSGNAIFCFQAVGIMPNNSEDIDVALSSATCTTDTAQSNANDLASVTQSQATSGFAAGEYVAFKVYRDADAGGDTMSGDARLVKVKIEYSVDEESDL